MSGNQRNISTSIQSTLAHRVSLSVNVACVCGVACLHEVVVASEWGRRKTKQEGNGLGRKFQADAAGTRLSSQAAEKDGEIASLRQQLAAKETERVELETAARRLRKKCEEKEAQLETARSEARASLESELASVDERTKTAMAGLEDRLREAELKESDWEEERRELEVNLSRERRLAAESGEARLELVSEVASAQSRADAAVEESAAKDAELESQQQLLEEERRRLTVAIEKLEAIQKKAGELETALAAVHSTASEQSEAAKRDATQQSAHFADQLRIVEDREKQLVRIFFCS